MKKEFIDHMYETRASVQAEIDRLVEACKSPRDAKCADCEYAPEAELKVRRQQIMEINKAIEKYFQIHKG